MKLAFVTILLAALSVYGEESKGKSDAHQQNPSQEVQPTDKTTSRTVIVVHEQQASGKGNNHAEKPPGYLSRLLSPENLPTVALVLIGIAATILGYCTLRAIRKQVDAMVSSERARIIAELIPIYRNTVFGWMAPGGYPVSVLRQEDLLKGIHLRHGLKFTNMGTTAGRISGYEIHCGLYDHKRDMLKVTNIVYNYEFERTLAGGATTDWVDYIDVHEFIKDPAAGIDTFTNWMIALVVVSYGHVFSAGTFEKDLFRFTFNPKTKIMERKPTIEADKKQARKKAIYPN